MRQIGENLRLYAFAEEEAAEENGYKSRRVGEGDASDESGAAEKGTTQQYFEYNAIYHDSGSRGVV